MVHLKLPSVVTIQPSLLNLPSLTVLYMDQLQFEEWYQLADDAFDSTLNLEELILLGLLHVNSFQFASLTRLKNLALSVYFLNATFEEDAFTGLENLETLSIWYSVSIDFILNYTFPKLSSMSLRNSELRTLDQGFFHKQKALNRIDAENIPFDCNCEMAWVSYVVDYLDWSVNGTCSDGNNITNVSNYIDCKQTSYHCFNSTFICPHNTPCVNTADGAYCECNDGYENANATTCVDIDECSLSLNICDQICTNTPGSYNCSCELGYTLNPGSYTCLDVDECSLSLNICDQICTNTPGSYNCSCGAGYILQSDLYSCSGIEKLKTPTFFLFFLIILLLLLL